MWNLFKKNEEIESLKKQISELQKRIREQDVFIQQLSEDRDYWKSQNEEFVKTYDSKDAKKVEKIKLWTSEKMLHSMSSSIDLQKHKDKIDYTNLEEAFAFLEKSAEIKKETEILRELGGIILEYEI